MVTGTVEVRITVGGFTLHLGGPHGTAAEPAADPETARGDRLAEALREAPAAQPSAVDAVTGAVARAEEVTATVERANRLVAAFAKGMTLDPDTLERQANALINLADRADREGRFDDQLRLARAGVSLLALVGRWVALVEVLRRTASAAAAVGDRAGEAWARHELGTFSLAGGDAETAARELDEAARLRDSIGDPAGADASRANLELARAAGNGWSTRFGRRGAVVAAVVAGALVLAAGGLAVASRVLDDGGGGEPTSATATDAESVEATTEETTAPENRPPTAEDVELPTNEDTETAEWTPAVADPDGDDLACAVVQPPGNGRAAVGPGCADPGTYVPAPDFAGDDVFVYAVSDGRGEPVTARVIVRVTPVNDAPVAADASVTTDEDTAVGWTPGVTDADGEDSFTCAIATAPANGSASVAPDCSGGTYTPAADFNGGDAFTYVVRDAALAEGTGTVNVTVTPVVDID